jgi:thioredoxin 1
MRKTFLASIALLAFILGSCSDLKSQGTNTTLTPIEFAAKIKEVPTPVIVDVRTPEEFSNGHLPNAKNFDWQGAQFDEQVSLLDMSKPVFIYCHSGKRSSAAASRMRTKGFKEVYELEGGITKWEAAHFPVTKTNSIAPAQ